MTPEPDSNPCPRCQRPLLRGHGAGNCAACLLATALVTDLDPAAEEEGAEETPQELGDFEILGEVGRGGSGVVYRARQRSVNRIVALKTLHGAGLNRRETFQRLQIEAEAVGRLEHPNIVPLYELGRHAGTHFLALRYFENGSLADLLKRQRLAPEEAARLIRTAARAVHHAHQRGVLHRDLKPSNFLLDEQGQPHVTDFGLAKLADGGSSLTLSTSVLGTPAYMAPEQASGHAKEAGTPADIYALGAVLFELLTGRPPFIGASALEILRQVADNEPPRPRSLNPRLDEDLEAICLHCLEKEPDRRYASAALLADDLERWLNHESISIRPTPRVERFTQWVRKRPLIAALGAACVLSVSLGLFATIRQSRTAQREREAALKEAYIAALTMAEQSIRVGALTPARDRLLALPERFRGWEWGRLVAQTYGIYRALPVLTNEWERGEFKSLWHALSEDARWLAAWSDGRLEVLDVVQGRTAWTTGTNGERVLNASFDPAGRFVALAGRQPAFRVIRTGSWDEVTRLDESAEEGLVVRFSPDGSRLLSLARTNRIQLWSAASFRPENILSAGIATVEDAWFSAEGRSVVGKIRSADGFPRYLVWDSVTGQETARVPSAAGPFVSVTLNSRSDSYSTVDAKGVASVWKLGVERPIFQTPPEGSGVQWSAVSMDARRLVTMEQLAGRLRFWNVETGQPLPTVPVTAYEVFLGADGVSLMTSAYDRVVHFWSWDTGEVLFSQPLDGGFSSGSLVTTPNGRWATAASRPNGEPPKAVIWPLPSGDRRFSSEFPVASGVLSPDGLTLATGSVDGSVCLWETKSGRRTAFLMGHQGWVYGLVWTADGKTLFSASADHTIRKWDPFRGVTLRTYDDLHRPLWGFDASPDGTRLAAADLQGRVAVWDGDDGRLLHVIQAATNINIWSLKISPDRRTLAVAGSLGNGGVWELETGKALLRFREVAVGTRNQPMALAYRDDGLRLVTGDLSGRIRIWDTTRWTLLASALVEPGSPADARFSPDGSRLFLLMADSSGARSGYSTVVVADGETGRPLVALGHERGMGFHLDRGLDGRSVLRTMLRPAASGSGTEIWTAFPWRDNEYPGGHEESLGRRVDRFAANSWSRRLGDGWNLKPSVAEPEWTAPRSDWPARDPRTPSICADLTPAYNGRLDRCFGGVGKYEGYENDLTALPRGRVVLNGITWDIRGVVTTGRIDLSPFVRWRAGRIVKGIPLPARGRRLHFLHAAQNAIQIETATAGRYRLNYTDGTTADLEMRVGRDIGDWWSIVSSVPCEAAAVAWEGDNRWAQLNQSRIRLYHKTWDNPHPEKDLTSVDLMADGNLIVPFVVAITVE